MVDWLKDEVILIADAVRANNWSGFRQTTAVAMGLSTLLSAGQLHPGVRLPDRFRSPASIQRKSYDIATRHPDYTGKPTKGTPQDLAVLLEFLAEPTVMQDKAEVIRTVLSSGRPVVVPADPDIELMADEGAAIAVSHLRRERDPKLRAAKIAAVKRSDAPVACEVCDFDFEVAYGSRGGGYIEVHHIRPLHDSGPVKTSLSDLALLCSNCHRMIHRSPWITPTELAELLG